MKIKFTNFGYHQLIEKRDIPLDRHIRKPKVLSVLEVIYFLVSVGLGVGSYASFVGGFYWFSGSMGAACLFLCLAAFFLSMESKLFLSFSLLSAFLLIAVCLFMWFNTNGIPVFVVVSFAAFPVVNIGILLLNKSVRDYHRWVESNG